MACQVLDVYFSSKKHFYPRHWLEGQDLRLSVKSCASLHLTFNSRQKQHWSGGFIWLGMTDTSVPLLDLFSHFIHLSNKTWHSLEIPNLGLCMLPNSSSDQSQGALRVDAGRTHPGVSNVDDFLSLHWYFCVFLK